MLRFINMRPEQWTPEQLVIVERLRSLLPERPVWIFVAPPKARCDIRNGVMLNADHAGWRAIMPPCDDACRCVVWALTMTEARAIMARRRAKHPPGTLFVD